MKNLHILLGALKLFGGNPKEYTKNKFLTKFETNYMDFSRRKSGVIHYSFYTKTINQNKGKK